jgi:hypothetical protein
MVFADGLWAMPAATFFKPDRRRPNAKTTPFPPAGTLAPSGKPGAGALVASRPWPQASISAVEIPQRSSLLGSL